MIYVDTSVVLAELFAEDERPESAFWEQTFISSRLLEYETWTRVHARGATESHAEATRALLGRISFVELSPLVLARALEPFPVALRTLDALHIGTLEFLRAQGLATEFASYDRRQRKVARLFGVPLVLSPASDTDDT